MINIENLVYILIYTLLINTLFSQINLFRDNKNLFKHKSFISDKTTPVFSGGFIFLFTILIFYKVESFIYYIFFILVFLIGLFSDLNFLKSPNKRFLIQGVCVIVFLIFAETFIESIRIEFVDNLLENYLFKIFFTSFCILILINGSNFIDGVNTLASGYYILVLFFSLLITKDLNINIEDSNFIFLIIFSLLCLFLLNFINKLYLGDNGAYLISAFVGIYLIDLSNSEKLISPYFIMNLLWYPAYENLFSIIRKIIGKKSALSPDNLHLHQLLYLFLKKNLSLNQKVINSMTGMLINFFNLIIFFLSFQDYSNTKYQIIVIVISLSLYNFSYWILKKLNKGFNN